MPQKGTFRNSPILNSMKQKKYTRAYAPKRAREWFITISAKHIKSKDSLVSKLESKNYDAFLVAHEVSKNDYDHFHAVIQHRNPVRFSALQNLLDKHGHIEPVRNLSDSIKYLEKDDQEPYMHGKFIIKRPGQRTDLKIMHQKILEGKTTVDELLTDPDYGQVAMQYRRGLRDIEMLRYKKQARRIYRDRQVIYIYGSPGVGKTTLALALASGVKIENYRYDASQVYFDEFAYLIDDYNNPYDTLTPAHKTIIFDEFTGQRAITEMNKITDIFPVLALPSRYQNAVAAHDRRIIIVSNFSIDDLYPDVAGVLRDAFRRRITDIVHVDNNHQINHRKLKQ